MEYVRRLRQRGRAIGRLRFLCTGRGQPRISSGRKGTGHKISRFVFGPESDTHGLVERNFIRTGQKGGANAAGIILYDLEEITTWQQQKNKSASV